MRQNPVLPVAHDTLNEFSLHTVELPNGCGVSGLIVGGVPCWMAWGPFGVIPRLFGSFWHALGAVAHAMIEAWQAITAEELATLDAHGPATLPESGLWIAERQPSPALSMGSVNIVEIWHKENRRLLVEEHGQRLLDSVFKPDSKGWKEARELAQSLRIVLSSDSSAPTGP